MDEDDLIERELEDSVELAVEDEKIKWERRQSWSKSHENSDHGKRPVETGDDNNFGTKGQSSRGSTENAEAGEMVDDASLTLNSRKRKAGSPVKRQLEGKKRHEYMSSYNHYNVEDGHKTSRTNYAEREYRRHPQESHL